MIAAVCVAASLATAVACAIASVQATLEHNLAIVMGNADARIIHQYNGRFADDWLTTARRWPEVELASARLGSSIMLVHADRRPHPETGKPLRCNPFALGVDFEQEKRLRPHIVRLGRLPQAPNEIVIDPLTADELLAAPGDDLDVLRFGGPPVRVRVAGVLERQRLGAIQRPYVDMPRATLAEIVGLSGEVTSIAIILKSGMDAQNFCDAHKHELPEVLALEPAEKVRTGYDRQVNANRFAFLIATILTFVSASFIVVTAMTVGVTQRQRELAVTRCIGASRMQMMGAQVWIGVLVGALGALLGIPLGIGLTAALVAWFHESLPGGMAINVFGLQLAAIGAIGSGLLGAVYPAYAAARVSPLQAMGVMARQPKKRTIVAVACMAAALIGAVMLMLALLDDSQLRFRAYAVAGLPLLHIGYFILATPVLVVVAAVIGPPLARVLRLPVDHLRGTLLATPLRNGFTAGALMVGVAIMVSTWSTATSLLNDFVGRLKFADAFAVRTMGIAPEQQRAIASQPFVTATNMLTYMPISVGDRQLFGLEGISPTSVVCVGFDPETFFDMNGIEWVAGSPETGIPKLEDGRGIIVADRFLTTRRLNIGDTLTLGSGTSKREFEVVGGVNSAALDVAIQFFGIRNQYMDFAIGMVFMDRRVLAQAFGNRDVYMMQVNLDPAVSDEEAERRMMEVAPGVNFKSGRSIAKSIDEIATALLAVQTTIAFAALVLACVGVGNVIWANIHARRYEYGVLRATGASRWFAARHIAGEALIIALAACITGTLLGVHLAALGVTFYRDLAGIAFRFAFPLWPTVAGCAVAVLLTLIAAIPGALSIIRARPALLLAGGRR